MGSKLRPGDFDCYANALPDEPMFILLARDRSAPLMLRRWADLRRANVLNAHEAGEISTAALEEELRKCSEADACSDEMTVWRRNRDGAWREGATPRQLLGSATAEELDAVAAATIKAIGEACGIASSFLSGALQVASHHARVWTSPLFSARRHTLLLVGTSVNFGEMELPAAWDSSRYEIPGMTVGDVELTPIAADRLALELMVIVDG